jgi:hypothetical protein
VIHEVLRFVGFLPKTEFSFRFPEAAEIAGGITMQAINRITHATINVNAVNGAAVVNGANAHRAYLSDVSCDSSPRPSCLGMSPDPRMSDVFMRTKERETTTFTDPRRQTSGLAGKTWQLKRSHEHLPATLWATLVLNRIHG